MRSSGPVSTCAFGLALTRCDVLHRNRLDRVDLARQQRRDARGVRPIGVKITSVRLCSGLPHQPGLGLNTVFTPGWWLSILKGPVPLALSAA